MGDGLGELVWDMGTKTALVLLLMYGALVLLKRCSGQRLSRRSGARIEVLSTAALGPGRSVHLLSAGGKTLLVGATGQQVSLLAELDPAAGETGEEEVVPVQWPAVIPGVMTDFSQSLAKAWEARKGQLAGAKKSTGSRRGGQE